MSRTITRRELIGTGTVSLALAVAACKTARDQESDVSPGEDLMREHGVLERLMTVYDAAAQRLTAGDRSVLDAVRSAAAIARQFVEQYHERIEEQYVFPRFEHANQLVDLVTVLRQQHDAGRGLTDRIAQLAQGQLTSDGDRAMLAAALRGYGTMFRPHVGREDTILFPAFRVLVGKDYDALGEKFEDEEHKRFGKDGFEHFVGQLPAIEAMVGVADLSRFTVRPEDLASTRG